jgi:hypothetical protein
VELRVVILGAELSALDGLPNLAKALYVALRARMDGSARTVGEARGVSWRALERDLYVEPHRGTVERSPTARQLRNALAWLIRARLVQMRSDKNAWRLVFFLPEAPKLSRVQHQPVSYRSGQPVRARSETLSTATGHGDDALSGQTSTGLYASAAAAAVSPTKATAERGNRAPSAPSGEGQQQIANPEKRLSSEGAAYRAPDIDSMIVPKGSTPRQNRAFQVIATEHGLTRTELQELLNELIDKMRRKKVENPVALLGVMARQLRAQQFYGGGAAREQSGGAPLSEEEVEIARMTGEGGALSAS